MSVKIHTTFTGAHADGSRIEHVKQQRIKNLSEAQKWAEDEAELLQMMNGKIVIKSEFGPAITADVMAGSFQWSIRNS